MQIKNVETSRLSPEGFSFDDDIDIELELNSNNLLDDLTHAHSILSEDEIFELATKYHLPMKGFWYIAPSSLRAYQSPPGGLAIYEAFLEAGYQFPSEKNLAKIFHLIGLCPSQLVPNGWRSLVSFIICCRGKGIAPKAELFHALPHSNSHFIVSYFSAKMIDDAELWEPDKLAVGAAK